MAIRRMSGVLAALAAASMLAGCATGPRLAHTEVTSFNEWSTLPTDRTYVFSRTLEYRDSLELKSYEDIVRDGLSAKGFTLATDPAQANLVVTLRPSVSGTSLRVSDPWPIGPFFGPYGGFYGRRFGPYDPFWSGAYGFGGFYDRDRVVEIFKRRLELDIDSRTAIGKRYYEGRVESTGQSDSLPRAMPILVRALFADFPGNNGQTRRVDVPIEERTVEQK